MTAETRNMLDCEIDQQELKKMLLGSDDKWRGTCKKAISYTLVIEPIDDFCDGDWYLHHFRLSVKNAKKVEVYVDDVEILSVSCRVSTVQVFSVSAVLGCVSVAFYIGRLHVAAAVST